ncbi:MAG: TetR/AcrR family transcriptional regulator, partial [bacterium]|nr:TetR/AcrR family transcriptional regulator [bacterium]
MRMGKAEITKPQILESAKEEFLEKGYQEASLRKIVKKIGLTTGAFYGYYRSKEAIFDVLVKSTAESFVIWYYQACCECEERRREVGREPFKDYQRDLLFQMIEYIYKDIENFRLLFCCSQGSGYERYMDKLVEIQAYFLLKL